MRSKNPHIPFAKSVIDYVARELGMEFIPGYKEKMSPAAQFDDSFEDKTPTPPPSKRKHQSSMNNNSSC